MAASKFRNTKSSNGQSCTQSTDANELALQAFALQTLGLEQVALVAASQVLRIDPARADMWHENQKASIYPQMLLKPYQMMSKQNVFYGLPHLLGTFDSNTETIPYLRADSKRAAFWQEKLSVVPCPRVGLAWSGNPLKQNNHNRSLHFQALKPFDRFGGPHLVSFQRSDKKIYRK